jgi:hypothetical protein
LLPVSAWKFKGMNPTTMRDQVGDFDPHSKEKYMNYNQSHAFYCGVDLHARSMFTHKGSSPSN